jgi:hypothetical protein
MPLNIPECEIKSGARQNWNSEEQGSLLPAAGRVLVSVLAHLTTWQSDLPYEKN